MASKYPDCDPEKDWETESEAKSNDKGKQYLHISWNMKNLDVISDVCIF